MTPLTFILILAVAFTLLLTWAFRYLPGERWQIIATLPLHKTAAGDWEGVNLTYYGLFCALASITGITLSMIMMLSIGLSVLQVSVLALVLVTLGAGAARGVARLVEGKKYTFTIGGAVFVGFMSMPIIIWLANEFIPGARIPMIPVLAAIMVSYTISEGIGRLACISFGCCYGKPMSDMPGWVQKLFSPIAFSFKGKTKKIAYESDQEGIQVFPIQGITAVIYLITGLTELYFFLEGQYVLAFILATVITIGWRFISELLRADYRGEGKISAYQWMSLLMIAVAVGLVMVLPASSSIPDLAQGLAILSQPLYLLAIQVAGFLLFLYFGWSKVTGAALSFHVNKERV